jgi:hypothetical protein
MSEKRKSYVGPKKVEVYLRGYKSPVEVTFPNSMAYHKFRREFIKNSNEETLQVWNGVNRVDFEPSAIDVLSFPKSELVLRKASKAYIAVDLFFGSGKKVRVHITGENRLRIIYKDLEKYLGATPKEDSPFLEIMQEENRGAYIRHDDVLVGIQSSKVE